MKAGDKDRRRGGGGTERCGAKVERSNTREKKAKTSTSKFVSANLSVPIFF